MKFIDLTSEQKGQIKNWYLSDKISALEIARRLTINSETIYIWLKKLGCEIRGKRKFSSKEVQLIIDTYLSGFNTIKTSEKLNIPVYQVRLILKNNKIKIREEDWKGNKKYAFDKNYFKKINTTDKAYFLGLLYADGCTSNQTLSISLQERDRAILEKFNHYLRYNKELDLKKYKDGTYDSQPKLTLYSKKLTQDLHKLGCIAAKSLILKFPTEAQVPSYLLRHFIRGYFDGDGCLYFNKQRRHCSWYIISTKEFCESVKSVIFKELNIVCVVSKAKNNNNSNTFICRVSSRDNVLNIMEWIYKDKQNLFIDRKFLKYILIKNTQPRPKVGKLKKDLIRIITPYGEVLETTNLFEWCNKNNLIPSGARAVVNLKRKSYKGYNFIKL